VTALHTRTHPSPVQGCFGCHIASLHIAPAAYNPEVADINRRDALLHKDRDAYSRLRRDGLQPQHVDGSARLETNLKDQIELDYGVPIKAKDLPRVKEIQNEVAAAQTSQERAW
jgi:hypothetical protein